MKKLKMYTDASFKDGVSTHHYRLLDYNGRKVKKRRTLKANEDNSFKAELHSISEAIRYLNQRDIKNVTLHTDNQAVYKLLNIEFDKSKDYNEDELRHLNRYGSGYLRSVMKQLNIDIKWITRQHKQIVLADYYCGQLMETVMKRKEYNEILLGGEC